jgi:Cu-processing system permease protein
LAVTLHDEQRAAAHCPRSRGRAPLNAVLLIARNAIRENLRRRILYLIILFIVALLVMTERTARFDAQVQLKMVRDFSYSIVSFFGLLVLLVSTFDQIPGEVESKTIYLPLARPISRQKFILGKYLGILGVLAIFLVFMGSILGLVLYFDSHQKGLLLDEQLAQALFLLFLKYASFASLIMLFTTFLSRPLAVTFSLFVYGYGHVNEFMEHAVSSTRGETIFNTALYALDIMLPKYSLLDLPGGLLYRQSFTVTSLGVLTAYALSFAALYLMFAVWSFASKEL